jgi:hypothetical protein
LPKGTKVKVGIWIGETKAWADCEVAYTTPGSGIGVKFRRISKEDLARVQEFLGSLAPFAQKPSYEL